MNKQPQLQRPLSIRPAAGSEPAIPVYYTEIPLAERHDNGRGQEEAGLISYWRLIRRRKATLLFLAALGGVAGFLITLPQVPLYQARASLEIQALNSDFMNSRQSDPNSLSSDYTASDAYIQTEIKILQSKSLADRTLDKMRRNGQLVTTSRAGLLTRLKHWAGIKDTKRAPSALRVGRELADSLSVRSAGQTRVVEISADSANPQMAADFVNTLAKEFIQQDLEARFQSSQNTGQWLTQQIDEMRIKLERSEDRLQTYARENGLMFTSEKNNVSEEKLRQLQDDLTRAQSDRIAKQTRYEIAREATPESLPDVLGDQTMRDDLTKLTELKRQYAELNAQYTPEHYKVTRVEAQIASLEAALQKQKEAILERIRNDNQEAVRRESLLLKAYEAQAGLVNKDGEKSIKYDTLKREVDSNRQIYEAMLQKVRESGIAAAMRASNIRVVDSAGVPESPYKPSPPQDVSLGILGGLLLGFAYVVTREQADRTIQQPGDATSYVNVPELGVIPSERGLLTRGGSVRRLQDGNGAGMLEAPLQPQRGEFVISHENKSVFAEAFRSTVLSIVYSGEEGIAQRVIVITSSNPSEGKTTISTNLAVAFASVNKKVLLIDGDLRKPRVHTLFGISNSVGLSDLLQNAVALDSPDNAVVHETTTRNLFVMTSGSSSPDSTVMLHAERLGELIKRLRTEFDIILMDSPPILRIPDARVMGRVADSVILVAQAGRTTHDAITATRERLTEDGTRVLGVILNDWDPKSSINGYYGYYDGTYKRDRQYYGKPSKSST